MKILEKGNTVLNLWPKMPAKELHMTHQICLHPASQVESHLRNSFASIQTHFNRTKNHINYGFVLVVVVDLVTKGGVDDDSVPNLQRYMIKDQGLKENEFDE